jgi:hypothetical protein
MASLQFIVFRETSGEGTFGLAADAVRASAAVLLILIMRGIAARQEQASLRVKQE